MRRGMLRSQSKVNEIWSERYPTVPNEEAWDLLGAAEAEFNQSNMDWLLPNSPGYAPYLKELTTPQGFECQKCAWLRQRGDADMQSVFHVLSVAEVSGLHLLSCSLSEAFLSGVMITRALEQRLVSSGTVRIMSNEPVLSISRRAPPKTRGHDNTDSDDPAAEMTLQTALRTVKASEVLVSAPPAALRAMGAGGDAVRLGDIGTQAHFQSIYVVPVAKTAALYASESAWWEGILGDLEARDSSDAQYQAIPYPGRGPNCEAVLHTAYAVEEVAVESVALALKRRWPEIDLCPSNGCNFAISSAETIAYARAMAAGVRRRWQQGVPPSLEPSPSVLD